MNNAHFPLKMEQIRSNDVTEINRNQRITMRYSGELVHIALHHLFWKTLKEDFLEDALCENIDDLKNEIIRFF